MATKNNNIKILLWVGGACAVLAGGIAAVVIVNRKNKKEELGQLLHFIANPSDGIDDVGETGTSEDLYSSNIWNPRIYMAQKGISKPTIDFVTAKKYAQQIWDAKGWGLAPDNERKVIAVFQKMRNRTDVAKLADAFPAISKGESLYPFIQSFLNNEDVLFSDRKNYTTEILNIIKKLPK